jgi:PIN domain nuclease of toxin-antitoxin system
VRLLLDTCTFLWILTDSPELSKGARTAFLDPANEPVLSAVSTWEIAVKSGLGHLRLPGDPARFIPEQRKRHWIGSLPLDEGATLLLGRLPPLHRDPFDRMIVCQALAAGMTILTPDEEVRRYAVPTLW